MHVHPPGTSLSGGYREGSKPPDWDRFCKIIHDSDVAAVGITDYFTLDGFFAFRAEYDKRYPDCGKVFFPNLELRLLEGVNRSSDLVNCHLVFRPNLKRSTADEFLVKLETQSTEDSGRRVPCTKLTTKKDFEKASVSREGLEKAIRETFGPKADRSEDLIVIVAANNDGIRADGGSQRKMALCDEIDKFSDGFFGTPSNVEYFLDTDRLETPGKSIAPKPVFAGSDAHSFDQLDEWLGKECAEGTAKHVTWIKADLSFEGFQQTLIEPSERVRLQATRPDEKEPYKVISRVVFKNSDEFPGEVVFNPSLNSIIGPRSSGKSALLAYIAHAVDPEYAESQQRESGGDVGPGAGMKWADVTGMQCYVEWAAADAAIGTVIYVPQNALFTISDRTDKITEMIRPTAFRYSAESKARFAGADVAVERANDLIRTVVDQWFLRLEEVRDLEREKRDLGDRKAVAAKGKDLEVQIDDQQKAAALSEEEVDHYQSVLEEIRKREALLKALAGEQEVLEPYVQTGTETGFETTDSVEVSVTLVPPLETLPEGLRNQIQRHIAESEQGLLERVKTAIREYRLGINDKSARARREAESIRADNEDLIRKGQASTLIDALIKDRATQAGKLSAIDEATKQIDKKKSEMDGLLRQISSEVEKREESVSELVRGFNDAAVCFEDMQFTVESEFSTHAKDHVSRGFNKTESSDFITNKPGTELRVVNVEKAISEPGAFVEHMGFGRQKLNQGEDAADLAKDVLTLNKEIRFVAALDGDHIGGFKPSTMTPGKKALFALTLLLARSEEPWPLLIDQPEDDLDSRAVCESIVDSLKARKRERQIIMVSHDANLVIGADSEEIIVANRHGADRPNRDQRMFEYLTGSLEHSQPQSPSGRTTLARAGIREHACEILDGGAEAFEKRKRKYRI